jgi:hypothetical protein
MEPREGTSIFRHCFHRCWSHKALSQLLQPMFWQKDQIERLLLAFHASMYFGAFELDQRR